MTFKTVLRIGLGFAGVEESTSYGTPALKVKGKLFARLKEDRKSIAVKTTFLDRDALMQLDPESFYITDHYRSYPWVLVRLATVGRERLKDVLEEAWRQAAPKRLLGMKGKER